MAHMPDASLLELSGGGCSERGGGVGWIGVTPNVAGCDWVNDEVVVLSWDEVDLSGPLLSKSPGLSPLALHQAA